MNEPAVSERLWEVCRQIRETSDSAGRAEVPVLVGVSKTVDAARVLQAYRAGLRVFAENRVQEAEAKRLEVNTLMPEATWHLIGHLQSNKARRALGTFDVIQSVDSVRISETVDRIARDAVKPIDALIEVNVAAEPSKSGFAPDVLLGAAERLFALQSVRPIGLMTVAPATDQPETVRWVFRRLRELRDALALRYDVPRFRELSMGMSADFRIAIEEGSTMVRIGRAIFGDRPAG